MISKDFNNLRHRFPHFAALFRGRNRQQTGNNLFAGIETVDDIAAGLAIAKNLKFVLLYFEKSPVQRGS